MLLLYGLSFCWLSWLTDLVTADSELFGPDHAIGLLTNNIPVSSSQVDFLISCLLSGEFGRVSLSSKDHDFRSPCVNTIACCIDPIIFARANSSSNNSQEEKLWSEMVERRWSLNPDSDSHGPTKWFGRRTRLTPVPTIVQIRSPPHGWGQIHFSYIKQSMDNWTTESLCRL